VRWLLEHGADASARNASGGTPLHSASANGRLGCARVLLLAAGEAGALAEATGVVDRCEGAVISLIPFAFTWGISIGKENDRAE
jgi:hypothetical protein